MIQTRKEYELNKKPAYVEQSNKPDIQTQETISDFEYILMYPDNIANNYHNGIYKVDLPEGIKEVEIISGMVHTQDIRIKTILEKDGFIFIRKREAKNE